MCKVKQNGPIFYMSGNTTVCLLMQNGSVVARGLSIHSRIDEFDASIGRGYALSRAKEALGRKADCNPIIIDAVRGNSYDWFDSSLAKDQFGDWKSYYTPSLTDTEKLLLKNNGKMVRVVAPKKYLVGC